MNIGDTVTSLTNTTLIIECPVGGTPEPNIAWSKNGKPLNLRQGVSINENGTLTVGGATLGDSGRYKCTALNGAGNDSASSDVTIVGE